MTTDSDPPQHDQPSGDTGAEGAPAAARAGSQPGEPATPAATGSVTDPAGPDKGAGAEPDSGQQLAAKVPTASLDKKKTIIGAIITVIILGLVFWGLSRQFGSFSEAWTKIQAMSTVALLALILVAVVNILVYPFPYMPAIPGLKYRPAFMVRQTSWMMAALVPAGGAFAIALQYLMLASYRVTPAAATSGIAITSVWSFFMTFLLPVLGVLAIASTGKLQAAWIYSGVAGLVILIAMIVVFWLILRSEASARKVGDLAQRLAKPVLRRLHRDVDVTESILSFRSQVVDVVKAHWIALTVSNLAVSFMQFMILFVAVRGVAGEASSGVTFAEIFAAFAISRLASLIPITPGGLGTVAAGLGGMLAVFGLNQQDILAAVLVWQVVQLLPQALTGIATLIGWRIGDARRRAAGDTAGAPA